jgi:hypothetical protein
MAGTQFFDNASAVGGYAPSWVDVRLTIIPKGKNAGVGPLRLRGGRELSGSGYSKEGVTHVYDASGTGEPAKITKGRMKPNEVSLTLDPESYRNGYLRYCAGPDADLFDFQVQTVGANGIPSTSKTYVDCTDTGLDDQTPNDGNPLQSLVKFMPRTINLPKPG